MVAMVLPSADTLQALVAIVSVVKGRSLMSGYEMRRFALFQAIVVWTGTVSPSAYVGHPTEILQALRCWSEAAVLVFPSEIYCLYARECFVG